MSQGKADLCELTQHAHELVLVDDPPVGTLALEGDHSGHWLTGLRSRQICTQPWALSDRATIDPLDIHCELNILSSRSTHSLVKGGGRGRGGGGNGVLAGNRLYCTERYSLYCL